MKTGYQPKDTGKPTGKPPSSGSGIADAKAQVRPAPTYVVHHKDHPPCLFTDGSAAQAAAIERGFEEFRVSLYLGGNPASATPTPIPMASFDCHRCGGRWQKPLSHLTDGQANTCPHCGATWLADPSLAEATWPGKDDALTKLNAALAEPPLRDKAAEALCRLADAMEVLVFRGGEELGKLHGRLDSLVSQVDGVLNPGLQQATDIAAQVAADKRVAELEERLAKAEDLAAALDRDLMEARADPTPLQTDECSPDMPHDCPDDCPTWHDWCHCTVGNLEHNIDRAEKAEAMLGDAQQVAATALQDLEASEAAVDHAFADARDGLLDAGVDESIVERYLGPGAGVKDRTNT